jgi:hypothetical protein
MACHYPVRKTRLAALAARLPPFGQLSPDRGGGGVERRRKMLGKLPLKLGVGRIGHDT